MKMSDHTIITVFEEDETGIKKNIRVGEDADTMLNRLELTPTKFVQEVARKLKDNKE